MLMLVSFFLKKMVIPGFYASLEPVSGELTLQLKIVLSNFIFFLLLL